MIAAAGPGTSVSSTFWRRCEVALDLLQRESFNHVGHGADKTHDPVEHMQSRIYYDETRDLGVELIDSIQKTGFEWFVLRDQGKHWWFLHTCIIEGIVMFS